MTHRLINTTLTRSNGDTFEPGDTLEPSEAELSAFGDVLVRVEDEEPDVSPDNLTVAELETEIGEINEVSALETLRSDEEDGKGRATALEAIDERIEELT